MQFRTHYLSRFLRVMVALYLLLGIGGFSFAQYATIYPRSIVPYELSICRVKAVDSTGISSGTGTLVVTPDRGSVVITAAHVVSSSNQVTVTWDGIQWYSTTLANIDTVADVAILQVPLSATQTIPSIPLATEPVAPDESCYVFGFGGDENTLRGTGGIICGHTTTGNIIIPGSTRGGDSGGPIIVVRDDQPCYIGPAWGTHYDDKRGYHIVVAGGLGNVLDVLAGRSTPAAPLQVRRVASAPTQQPVSPYQPASYSSGSS